MKIERVKLSTLTEDSKNARRHGKRNLSTITASLQQFGQVEPLVVRKGTRVVIGGNGRLQAMRALGWTEADIVEVELTDAQATALALALNRTAELAEWDIQALGEAVERIKGEVDAEALGFGDYDLKTLLKGYGTGADTKELDGAPEPPKKPFSRAGDFWRLGDHRLVCGSATEKADWDRLTGPGVRGGGGAGGRGKAAAMIFTDPPYGVSYASASGKHKAIAGDDLRGGELVRKLLKPALGFAVGAARGGAAYYIWHASSTREDFAWAMKAAGLVERQYLVWVKASIVLGHADYQWAHEPCFYAAKAGASPAFYGDRSQPTVWRVAGVPRGKDGAQAMTVGSGLVLTDGEGGQLNITARMPKGKKVRSHRVASGEAVLVGEPGAGSGVWEVSRETNPDHPTQKPVALARIAIENSSKPGEVVLDPFLGSGCTLLAAEALGRTCYGLELEPGYVDVAVRRWAEMSGKTPSLERGGKEAQAKPITAWLKGAQGTA